MGIHDDKTFIETTVSCGASAEIFSDRRFVDIGAQIMPDLDLTHKNHVMNTVLIIDMLPKNKTNRNDKAIWTFSSNIQSTMLSCQT